MGGGAAGADLPIELKLDVVTFAVSDPDESMATLRADESPISEVSGVRKGKAGSIIILENILFSPYSGWEAVYVMRIMERMRTFIRKDKCKIYDIINLRMPDFQLNVIRQTNK
jgi:hypothetical protein